MEDNISLMEKADWLDFRKDKSDQKINSNVKISKKKDLNNFLSSNKIDFSKSINHSWTSTDWILINEKPQLIL